MTSTSAPLVAEGNLTYPPYEDADLEFDIISAIEAFNLYYMVLVLAVGLVGNVLTILVFQTTKLRKFPSSLYLTALASADIGMLLCQLIMRTGRRRLMHIDGICQTVYYFSQVFSFLSVWYVVAFTIERYIVVAHPLRRLSWCTRRRARLIVALVSLTPILLHLSVFYTVRVIQVGEIGGRAVYRCSVPPSLVMLGSVFNYVDAVLTLLVPMSLIIVLNVRIAQYMWAALAPSATRRKSGSLEPGPTETLPLRTSSTLAPAKANGHHKASPNSSSNSRDEKITKMLLTISIFFVVMNLPDHIVRITILFLRATGRYQLMSLKTHARIRIISLLTSVLFQTNFAINFFLYNIVGNNFRRYLKALLWNAAGFCLPKKSKAYLLTQIKQRGASTVTGTKSMAVGSSMRPPTPSPPSPLQPPREYRRIKSAEEVAYVRHLDASPRPDDAGSDSTFVTARESLDVFLTARTDTHL